MEFIIISALLAYLIGSIPFGLLLTKAAGLGDIRTIGSGNIGATNVLRTGKKWLAALTLLLDFAKGYIPIYYLLQAEHWYQATINCDGPCPHGIYFEALPVAALFVILGHMFPIWLKLKGGKGVACLFGVGFALSYHLGLWMAICWLTVFALYRFSSLAAIVGIPAGIIIASQNEAVDLQPYFMALPVLLMIIKHHENIRRLMKGDEHRFSFLKKEDDNQ